MTHYPDEIDVAIWEEENKQRRVKRKLVLGKKLNNKRKFGFCKVHQKFNRNYSNWEHSDWMCWEDICWEDQPEFLL